MTSIVPSLLAGLAYYFGVDAITGNRKGGESSGGGGGSSQASGRTPMHLTSVVKFSVATILTGGVVGAWVLYTAQDAARRRRLDRARRSSHRPKRSLGELAEFGGGLQSSARIVLSPREFPTVSSSWVHLTLPARTKTRAELCLCDSSVNAFYVVSGSGVAFVDGAETALGPGDSLVFRPNSSFYVANTGWRGASMALLWMREPAAPAELLARNCLVDGYDDGSGFAVKAARAVASGLVNGASLIASGATSAATALTHSRSGSAASQAPQDAAAAAAVNGSANGELQADGGGEHSLQAVRAMDEQIAAVTGTVYV